MDLEMDKLVAELKATLDRVAAAHAQGRDQDGEDFVVLRGSVESVIEMAGRAVVMFDLSSIQPSGDVISRNQSRVRGDQEPCVVCGKPVRDVEKYQVHMSNQGDLYPLSIDTDAANGLPEGTMYYFPVGPDCAKKVPDNYLHKES